MSCNMDIFLLFSAQNSHRNNFDFWPVVIESIGLNNFVPLVMENHCPLKAKQPTLSVTLHNVFAQIKEKRLIVPADKTK